MGIICRPILLHNEYVPSIVGKREYKYIVFGHHDGMTIEEAIPIDTTASFEKIFSLNARYEGEESNYSTQFFFGFHDNNDIEEQFWKSDFPFTFVTFIQLKEKEVLEYQKYLEGGAYIADEFQALSLKDSLDDVRVAAYYELGNSNIILAVKCRRCEIGTKIINNLHQDVGKCHPFSICNSYSILAVDRSYIEKEEKNSLITEDIEQLELRVIEKKTGSINELHDKIEAVLKERGSVAVTKRKGLLGTDDEAILIYDVLWKDFLNLYREEKGILLNSNKCSQDCASAITTKVLYDISDAQADRSNEELEEGEGDIDTPFCNWMQNKVEQIYKNQASTSALTERKNLVMLINALRKIEYSHESGRPFNDYCFFTIMLPTAMLIKLRERDGSNAAEYYQFIKYIKLCMQNFTKPDRVYQQVTDFNIRYFDIPSKLVTLCNAYLYYAKNALNVDSAGQYEFLLCAGMNNKTEVNELYQGVDKISSDEEDADTIKSHHLFRVEIPEPHVYNLKLMFFTLGHEVSHFVGRAIRKRDDRFEIIMTMSSRMVVLGLQEYIGYTGEFDKACFRSEIWDEIEEKIAGWLRFYVEAHLNERYMEEVEYREEASQDRIKNQVAYYKLFYRHTTTLKVLLDNAIHNILYYNRKELFDTLIWRDVEAALDSGKINFGDRDKYYEKQKSRIDGCVDAFAGRTAYTSNDLTVKNGIEDIMFLLEECYADVSCILLLQLPLKDYLENIVETLKTTGESVENIAETRIITRLAIVMGVMSYDMEPEDNHFMWKDKEVMLEEDDDRVFSLQQQALLFGETYISDGGIIEPEKMDVQIQRINHDNKILTEAVRYLLKCRREYNLSVRYEDEEKARRFYSLTELSEAGSFFAKTEDILEEYEKDIYKEIQKLVESEKGSHEGESGVQ